MLKQAIFQFYSYNTSVFIVYYFLYVMSRLTCMIAVLIIITWQINIS